MCRSFAKSLLISYLLLAAHVTPAWAISISYNTGDGSKAVSSWENFNLDDTAFLSEATILDSGKLYQTKQAAGSGSNSIKQQLSGNGYTVENSIDSLGALSVAAFAAASSEGVDMGQQVAGAGELSASIQGIQGADSAGQEASVLGGVLSSSQSLSASAGDGVSAAQATEMAGIIGRVSSGAISEEKAMITSGSFLGAGTLEAVMTSQSEGQLQASMAVDGVEWLKQSDLDEVSQDGVGMAVEGLRLDRRGDLGSFSMQAASLDRADYEIDRAEMAASSDKSSEEDGVGSAVMYLNNPNAYILTGWKWTQNNPQIKMYLKKDANFNNEGLDAVATKNAIEAAANTWDNAVAQNLFADSNLVTITEASNINTDTRDGYNTHGWKPITEGLAFSRTYYSTAKVSGYYPALESDVTYDSDYQWATDGRDIDVQSVALHEMGHTIGLGDLYGKPEYAGDTDEIMHYYDAPQHTLGVGDRTGAQKLYGATGVGIGIYRSGQWFLDYYRDGYTDQFLSYGGLSGDRPVSGDWDGNSKDDIGIYRSGWWYLYNEGTLPYGGLAGDMPVTGDWNGDGKDDVGIYRSGRWYLYDNNNGVAMPSVAYGGLAGDLSVTGDWNGDGKDDVGIYRSGWWYLYDNNNGVAMPSVAYGGLAGDLPVTGDWNSDGKDDVGIYRSGWWYLYDNNNGVAMPSVAYGGLAGDLPVTGKW
jgi:hypothetical protein